MASVAVPTLVCFLFLSAMLAPYVEAAITSDMVIRDIFPCLNYLRSRVGDVPSKCCAGVRSLNAAANTTADRHVACDCLKEAAARMRGINYTRAEGLPSACKVNIPYKISPSTDCATIK